MPSAKSDATIFHQDLMEVYTLMLFTITFFNLELTE
jgi:hypothetical protein